MYKVFEAFDFMEAGRVQSLLEANGIETFMKNEFSTGALGELPFVEVAPMVFVVHEADIPRAIAIVRQDQADPEGQDAAEDSVIDEAAGTDPEPDSA